MKLTPIKTNMTEIETNEKRILFSYKTPVALIDESGNAYRTSHFWSKTTSRHINQWLDGREAEQKEQAYFDKLV